MPDLYYFHDSKGNEVDLLVQSGRTLRAIEIKSAQTFKLEQLKGIRRFQSITNTVEASYLIYNGKKHELSDHITALNFKDLARFQVRW